MNTETRDTYLAPTVTEHGDFVLRTEGNLIGGTVETSGGAHGATESETGTAESNG
jgi:hypothetical protein